MVFAESIYYAKDAAGIAGNIFALGLFVSPMPTFKRIIRNGSTEQFSGMPYVYALLNCLICTWYGSPLISIDNTMVMTVNSVGAVFQLAYIITFLIYADKVKKVRMSLLLVAVICIFAIIVGGSLEMKSRVLRRTFVGFLSVASLVSMFASPLFIIRLVIRMRSVEFMPFFLSLSTFLMSISFFTYGMLNKDAFVSVPNGIGTVLGTVQLILYFYFKDRSNEDLEEAMLIVSNTE